MNLCPPRLSRHHLGHQQASFGRLPRHCCWEIAPKRHQQLPSMQDSESAFLRPCQGPSMSCYTENIEQSFEHPHLITRLERWEIAKITRTPTTRKANTPDPGKSPPDLSTVGRPQPRPVSASAIRPCTFAKSLNPVGNLLWRFETCHCKRKAFFQIAKPGMLAFRELPGRDFDLLHSGLKR